jgi:endonuclease/exonuclease/phosphatase family metal-dependent hydrolase
MEFLGGMLFVGGDRVKEWFSYCFVLGAKTATALLSHSMTWRRGVCAFFWGTLGLSLGAADFAEERDRLSFSPDGARESKGESVRVMSWNVKAGALFPSSMPNPRGEEAGARVGRFGRILRAVRPDVLCLQEIWPLREQSAILAMLNRELPLANGNSWSLHREVDVVIASRYPLALRRGDRVIHYPLPEMPDFHYGQAMCFVDLPDERFTKDLYVISAHFRSRSGAENIGLREQQADSIAGRIQDLLTPGGDLDVVRGTPIIVVGDFNVYDSNEDDPKRHLKTMIAGRVDADGTLAPPDWDRSSLKDLGPSINGEGKANYTWRNDTLPYPPGALDRVLFTDSVLRVRESFIVNASLMSAAQLAQQELKQTDSLMAGRKGEFDHLPIVVEFEFQEAFDQ